VPTSFPVGYSSSILLRQKPVNSILTLFPPTVDLDLCVLFMCFKNLSFRSRALDISLPKPPLPQLDPNFFSPPKLSGTQHTLTPTMQGFRRARVKAGYFQLPINIIHVKSSATVPSQIGSPSGFSLSIDIFLKPALGHNTTFLAHKPKCLALPVYGVVTNTVVYLGLSF